MFVSVDVVVVSGDEKEQSDERRAVRLYISGRRPHTTKSIRATVPKRDVIFSDSRRGRMR